MKICVTCKKELPIEEFGNNRTKFDGKQPYCKGCSKVKDKKCYDGSPTRKIKVVDRRKKIRLDHQQFILDYLRNHPCVDCGEDRIPCLDFDHVRGTKIQDVPKLIGGSLNRLISEIKKCEVRCANCHRIRTFNKIGTYKSQDFCGKIQ